VPEYLSPGVYLQEVDSGPRPIEGVGTACAAFVGMAPSGPANTPVLITNWSQYVQTFGHLDQSGRRLAHIAGSHLSHAVYGYFLNGGGRCYVTRIVPSSTAGGSGSSAAREPAQLQLPSRGGRHAASLTLRPKGVQVQDIEVEVLPPTGAGPPEGTFSLRVRMGTEEELHENVSLGRRAARNVTEAIAQSSNLVTVVEEQAAGSLAERAPEFGIQVLRPLRQAELATIKVDDFGGDITQRSGIEGLEIAEDVTMVACPDLMAAYQAGHLDRDGVKAVQLKMIAHCEQMGDRIAILDPLPDLTPGQVSAWRQTETSYDSKYAALYYPWIVVAGPDGMPQAVPSSGHVAGIWARNDMERGVHKAPANEVLRGVLTLASSLTKGEQDFLNPIGVNCIRAFPGRGIRVWGARTLSSDPAWRYLNVRRLFNFVERSLEVGTQWVVFEANNRDLWERVKRDIGAFLHGMWDDGALVGATPAEAFFVKCDEELNPPDVRDRGLLLIDVGIAPVKPAEFVIVRLSQYYPGAVS
jgi:phage tail sheath protein FI